MLKILMTMSVLILMLSSEASALIENEYLGEITVTIVGAKRTRPRYIESLVEKCLEKGAYRKWEDVDTEALGQCLRNSRIFSKADVRIDKPEITANISERWTLIPIPFFYASDEKKAGGIFLYETNFLGYGKTAGFGGSVSTEGNTFSLMFSDPSLNFTDYTLSLMAYKNQTELNAYNGDDIIDGYKKRDIGVFFTPGYRVTPALKLSASLAYSDRRYSQVETYAVPDDNAAASAGISVSYENSDYKLFHNDGVSGNISWISQVHRSGGNKKTNQTTARFQWDIPLFKTHALETGVRGSLQSQGSPGDVLMYGRGKGFRGIQPSGLWTRKILAVSVDYQIQVLKTGHGTFTVAPFADYGIYKPFLPDTGSSYAAYGVGAYYFINLLNLPGVGVIAGNNEEFMGPFVDLQIGMGF
jgi:outer membrane protein assembly factor BamA